MSQESDKFRVGLASDLRCIQCDHMLRGIDATGMCPECGTPVSKSAPYPRMTLWGDNSLQPARDVIYGPIGVVRLLLVFATLLFAIVAIFLVMRWLF
jgi:hypothetical protein